MSEKETFIEMCRRTRPKQTKKEFIASCAKVFPKRKTVGLPGRVQHYATPEDRDRELKYIKDNAHILPF